MGKNEFCALYGQKYSAIEYLLTAEKNFKPENYGLERCRLLRAMKLLEEIKSALASMNAAQQIELLARARTNANDERARIIANADAVEARYDCLRKQLQAWKPVYANTGNQCLERKVQNQLAGYKSVAMKCAAHGWAKDHLTEKQVEEFGAESAHLNTLSPVNFAAEQLGKVQSLIKQADERVNKQTAEEYKNFGSG